MIDAQTQIKFYCSGAKNKIIKNNPIPSQKL